MLVLGVLLFSLTFHLTWVDGFALEKDDAFKVAREEMVRQQIESRGVKDKSVLKAIRKVPRHLFVLERYLSRAYGDYPLPIGEGQTISQPYIVALMTELLELDGDEKILEIGTGSGYQATILAEIVPKVWTIEIIPELANRAEATLKKQGYTNITVKIGDGYYGWEEYAPFDGIIVTAAPDHVPPPLIQQLKDKGIMVIPVGPPGAYQTLWKVKKDGERLIRQNITGVAFVPLVRK